MAYTTALYYPWIEIRNEKWLKTSILYWDTIRTITPRTLDRPYGTDLSRQLEDEGFLQPLYVAPDFEVVKAVAEDFLTFLETDQAKRLLYTQKDGHHPTYIHPDKLPRALEDIEHIHPDKLPYELRRMFEFEDVERRGVRGWYRASEPLAAYYMTLLATRLANEIGASLATEQGAADGLSLVVKSGNVLPNPTMNYRDARRWRGRRRYIDHLPPIELAEGALATLALEGVGFEPTASLDKLLKFRRTHSAELGRFRAAIGTLASGIDTSVSLDAARQQIWDTYKNELEPAVEELKSALTGSRIKFLSDTLLKTTFLSAGSTSLLAAVGLSVPQALLVGAGVSLVAMGIMYDLNRRTNYQNSPYAYLLNLQRSFGQ
jgi:hypothetical protein